MVAAATFLVLLDAVIISATPTAMRITFALIVTIVVGFAILRIWRSNARIESGVASTEKGTSAGDGRGKKRQTK